MGIFAAALWLIEAPSSGSSEQVGVVFMQTENDADSAIIYQQNAAVLIDTGEEADAGHIIEKLNGLGIKRLDYLILSHPDADHIGGAKAILSQIPADCVIQPYCQKAGKRSKELNSWLDSQSIPIIYPTHTQRLKVGQMRILVYPPLEKSYSDTNNYSLAVLVQHGRVNMLFAGDALRKRSDELLLTDWSNIALYKVPHHGRANKSSKALFDALHPAYAVVTAKSADKAILDAAAEWGTVLRFTSEGDCAFISDKKTLTMQ